MVPKTKNKYNDVNTYINKFRKQDRLRLKAIEEYDKELREMNRRKRGRPYKYTHTIILYSLIIAFMFRFSLRETIAYIVYNNLLHKTPNFRTLSYRFGKVPIHKYNEDILQEVKGKRYIAVSIDATGLSFNTINPWFEEKHNVKGKRKWIKLEVIVDIESKKVLYHNLYTNSEINEAGHKRFRRTIDDLIAKGYDVKVLYADALYDSYDNFQYLENKDILPVIKIRKRSVLSLRNRYEGRMRNGKDREVKRMRHLARDYYALEQIYWERYKSRYKYGNREAVESAFSSIKRKFGDKVRFKKHRNVVNEVNLIIYLYNLFRDDE